MAVFFLDTSAIVKRYVAETGSAWVTSIVLPASGNQLYIAEISAVEVISAVTRRSRTGTIDAGTAAAIIAQFRHELTGIYRRLEIIEDVIQQAMLLAERHGLRAYDAIQLAAAVELQRHCQDLNVSLIFVCADVELNAAARLEGCSVDDPNQHS